MQYTHDIKTRMYAFIFYANLVVNLLRIKYKNVIGRFHAMDKLFRYNYYVFFERIFLRQLLPFKVNLTNGTLIKF